MKLKKLFAVSMISVVIVSPISYACGPSHQMTKARVTRFVNWINTLSDFSKSPTEAEINQYFSPTFKQTTNGQVVATDAKSLIARRHYAAKQYSSVSLHGPIQDELIDDNKAMLRSDVELVDVKGSKRIVNDIMIIDFDKQGKISSLQQVFDQGNPVS